MRLMMNRRLIVSFIALAHAFLFVAADGAETAYRHWPFDILTDNGTATPDASPHRVHCQLSGQELCEGVIGKALRFKTSNKGLALGDLSLQAPATLCFWIKSDSSQADGRILSQVEGPGKNSHRSVYPDAWRTGTTDRIQQHTKMVFRSSSRTYWL